MNYHLMIDDKFIDKFIDSAEIVAPGKNIYIFTFSKPAKYVKSTQGIHAPYGSSRLKKIVKNISHLDKVFVHWFHNPVMQVVNNIELSTPVYLFFWGGDFLEQVKELHENNFDFFTKEYLKKNKKSDIFNWLKHPSNYLRIIKSPNYYFSFLFLYVKSILSPTKKLEIDFEIRKRFLNRLNFFCNWNILDLEIIRNYYECNPRFLNFFYDVGLENVEMTKNYKNKESNIWLGNSDTETNNHLDAINSLSNYKNNDIKVTCPLNYGNKNYANFITSQGQEIFSEKWNSIRNFMPLDKYYNILNDVDVAVMFHNRSQAAGNILAFIKLGKKVFLKKESTIYQFLINNGVMVFDSNIIKDISFNDFIEPIPDIAIQSNIKIVAELFSKEKQLKYLEEILN